MRGERDERGDDCGQQPLLERHPLEGRREGGARRGIAMTMMIHVQDSSIVGTLGHSITVDGANNASRARDR